MKTYYSGRITKMGTLYSNNGIRVMIHISNKFLQAPETANASFQTALRAWRCFFSLLKSIE